MSNEKQKNFRIILASIVGAAEEAKIAYNKAVAGRDETFEKIEMINDQISGLRGDRDTQFKIGQPMLAVPIEIEIAELEAGRATINVEMAEIEIQMRKYDETVAGLHVKLYRALADNNIGIEIINIRNADDHIDEAKKFFTKNFI